MFLGAPRQRSPGPTYFTRGCTGSREANGRHSDLVIAPQSPIYRHESRRDNQAFPGFGFREFPYVTVVENPILPPKTRRGAKAVSDPPKRAVPYREMVAKDGIEPPTHGFSVRCSTN